MAISLLIVAVIVLTILLGLVSVNQGTVAIVTMFGKYRRVLRPGLNFKIPIWNPSTSGYRFRTNQ